MATKKKKIATKSNPYRRRPGPRSKPLVNLTTDKTDWDDESVKALRDHLQMTQTQMAETLGTRQQTISEWEVGMHKPRGGMARLLSIVAERAEFQYQAKSDLKGKKE